MSKARLPLTIRLIIAALIGIIVPLTDACWLKTSYGGGVGAVLGTLWWLWSGGGNSKFENTNG